MTEKLIEVKDLKKYYNGGEVKALDGISVDICKGDVIAVIGPSGGGKSTFLRSLNLLEKPTSGSILFDGVDITGKKVDLPLHRQKMGMVFQHFNLFPHKTILQNLTMAPIHIKKMPKAEAEEKAMALLQRVGLADRADAYPAQLSGGQKQRVAIARALATEPHVLLCDEATSALDPTTTVQILDLLREINQRLGVTIVVITHEMRVIEKICNRVAVIDASEIAEEGLVSEVFLRPKSAIARRLIMPQGGEGVESVLGSRCIRVTFDGSDTAEPIISKMTLECRAAVNIVFANTKSLDGKVYGQMVLQLPADESAQARVLDYMQHTGLAFSEEVYTDGN